MKMLRSTGPILGLHTCPTASGSTRARDMQCTKPELPKAGKLSIRMRTYSGPTGTPQSKGRSYRLPYLFPVANRLNPPSFQLDIIQAWTSFNANYSADPQLPPDQQLATNMLSTPLQPWLLI